MGDDVEVPVLTRVERVAVALGRFANERPLPKRLQHAFQSVVTRPWVIHTIARRLYVDGLEELLALEPDRGVLLCANHRSFFDMYVGILPLYVRNCSWFKRVFFPVRSNFFYETPIGMFLNFAVGGGAMYPPIFRDRRKAAYNGDALDRIARFLSEPDVIVGMHPEGTRNKADDPYQLLPAQPGVGQIVLHGKPVVIPMFINGLSNDFVADVIKTNRRGTHRTDPVIAVFGDPIDYSEFTSARPRLALYKKVSDRILDAISELGARERVLRDQITSGELDDHAPGWLMRHSGDGA